MCVVQEVQQLDLFGDMSTPPDIHSPTVSQPAVGFTGCAPIMGIFISGNVLIM